MNPKVSIVIPVYNGANYLKEAIDSALAQTYKNIEIIIVNYGASYNVTTETAAGLYDEKVKFYKMDSSSMALALNHGIKKMSGQYFTWLHEGGTYAPEKVQKQIELISGSESTIVASGWTALSANGRKEQTHTVNDGLEKYPGCFLAFAREAQLNTCAMLIPVEMLKKNDSFDESLPPSHDYKMLNRLILAGASLKVINQPLLSSKPEFPADSKVNYDLDFVYSDIISTLQYTDIIGYFGSREDAVSYYKTTLDLNFPRTAAFLMTEILKGTIAVEGEKTAKIVLLEDLSMLQDSEMGTGSDSLISKVADPTSKKKILFSSAYWLTGGMERVMSVLFRELKDDYEIYLITPYSEIESSIDLPDYVTSIKIHSGLFKKHYDSLILSYALLLDINVVIGYMNMFAKQLNLYDLCVGTKIKTVASNHEYYFYPYKSSAHNGVVEKRLKSFNKCNALIWPLNFNAALCGMYAENNYVIGNPNNFEVSQKAYTSRDNIIICVGRFNDYVKRIDRMLYCFSLVLQKVPDAKLVLVGKYDLHAPFRKNDTTTVNDLISKLDIPRDSLNFVGEVSNVHDYYPKAKALMLTSDSEGFGMVINEAACFGVPSVCNYMPGVEDIVTDGKNGFVTEQDDMNAMSARISDLLTNDDLHKRFSKNAKNMVTAYDAKNIGDKWRHLLNTLIESNHNQPLQKKLNSVLGYTIADQKLFLKVVASELNEIFYMAINDSERHKTSNKILLIASKVGSLPKRLKANIEYEGAINTGTKIIKRSYRLVRSRLQPS